MQPMSSSIRIEVWWIPLGHQKCSFDTAIVGKDNRVFFLRWDVASIWHMCKYQGSGFPM